MTSCRFSGTVISFEYINLIALNRRMRQWKGVQHVSEGISQQRSKLAAALSKDEEMIIDVCQISKILTSFELKVLDLQLPQEPYPNI